jgi:hypothetical protein
MRTKLGIAAGLALSAIAIPAAAQAHDYDRYASGYGYGAGYGSSYGYDYGRGYGDYYGRSDWRDRERWERHREREWRRAHRRWVRAHRYRDYDYRW